MTFDQKIDELMQDLLRARAAYEAWWNLRDKRIRSKYTETMNTYVDYFRIAIHSHFVAMLMALFRLYDKEDTLSIAGQINALQSVPGISRTLRLRLKRALARAQPSAEKIRNLRNKVFAHRDRAYTYERAFREAHLSPKEVRRLIERTLRMLNALSAARNKPTHTFGRHTERDLRHLLRDLHGVQDNRHAP